MNICSKCVYFLFYLRVQPEPLRSGSDPDLCPPTQATECTWSSLVLGRPPPRCLVDIPDSVSSLCLRLLSGQLGLKQHDPTQQRSSGRHSVCVYIQHVCVWLCISNTDACFRYERCHIRKILTENRPTKTETPSIFGKISRYSDMCWVSCCWLFFPEQRKWSGCRKLLGCIRGMSHKQKMTSRPLADILLAEGSSRSIWMYTTWY